MTTSLFDPNRPDALTWEKLAGLRKLNVLCALFQIAAASTLLALSPIVQTPVYAVFASSGFVAHDWSPTLAHEFNFTLSHLSSSVLIVSSVYHFLCGTLARDTYEAALLKNQNAWRFLQLCLSSSLSRLLLASLVGVMDLHLHVALLGLTVAVRAAKSQRAR